MKTDDKKIYLVDSGLSFNLPFPVALRPQREIELYITFDFSSRKTDATPPFRVQKLRISHIYRSTSFNLLLTCCCFIMLSNDFPGTTTR